MKWKELIPILSILVGFFLILIFLKGIWNDMTYLRCISSTPEMIVFQTGPLKPLGVAISGLVYLLITLFFLFSTISEIKNWKNERQSQNKANMKDIAKLMGWFLVFCLSVFLTIAVIFYAIADNVSSEKIVISNYEQVIYIEKHYLLGNEEHIRISFDQIDHILYGNYNGGNAEDRPPYSEVKLTRLDGVIIEIYKSDWEESEIHYLARVIAEAAWVKLIEEEYK